MVNSSIIRNTDIEDAHGIPGYRRGVESDAMDRYLREQESRGEVALIGGNCRLLFTPTLACVIKHLGHTRMRVFKGDGEIIDGSMINGNRNEERSHHRNECLNNGFHAPLKRINNRILHLRKSPLKGRVKSREIQN